MRSLFLSDCVYYIVQWWGVGRRKGFKGLKRPSLCSLAEISNIVTIINRIIITPIIIRANLHLPLSPKKRQNIWYIFVFILEALSFTFKCAPPTQSLSSPNDCQFWVRPGARGHSATSPSCHGSCSTVWGVRFRRSDVAWSDCGKKDVAWGIWGTGKGELQHRILRV